MLWPYLLVAGAGIGVGLYWRGRRDPATDTTDTVVATVAQPRIYRRLDLITVRCDELHPGSPAPTGYLARRYAVRDLKALRRHGWGSTDHVNMCYRHNSGDIELRKLHVVCRYGDCGERDVLRADNIASEFSRLQAAGWVNVAATDEVLCPFHSGARPPQARW